MTRRTVILGLLMATPLASATVTEWSGRTLGTDYVVTNDINVEIRANGTFKFQAEDGGGNLDVIGNITVADGVTGTVTVFIERDTDDDSPGATHVGAINLTNSHAIPVVGNLAELRITGDLGTADEIVIRYLNGPLTAAAIVDKMTINRELDGPISVTSMADLDVNLGSGVGVTHSGDITIGGNYANKIDIMAGGYGGKITIAGDLTGESDLVVSGAFDGDLTGVAAFARCGGSGWRIPCWRVRKALTGAPRPR